MTLDGTISCIEQVVSAFTWREGFEDVGDAIGDVVEAPFLGLSQKLLELGEHLFDGIEVRAIGGQVEKPCAGGFEGAPDGLRLVAAEIVHDDNVAWLQRWQEELFDIAEEALAVDRAVQQARRGDGI